MNRYNNIPETVRIPVYNMGGETVETLDLPVSLFGGKIYADLLRQAVITHEANRRAGTAKTKTRREVAYGGAKPWPQKGTGNARAGSRGSPVWVGGGVAHGPKVRDYSKKLNRKMRKRALASAILGKALDGEVKLIDAFEPASHKTRDVVRILENLGVERSFMIVTPRHDPLLWRCTRNIRGASMMAACELNAYAVLKAREVVFVREAFDAAVDGCAGAAGEGAETVEAG